MTQELIRDISPDECRGFQGAKTGDVLPDGSVVLRRRDMNRMRLAGLNSWLEGVLERGSTIAIYDDTIRAGATELED